MIIVSLVSRKRKSMGIPLLDDLISVGNKVIFGEMPRKMTAEEFIDIQLRLSNDEVELDDYVDIVNVSEGNIRDMETNNIINAYNVAGNIKGGKSGTGDRELNRSLSKIQKKSEKELDRRGVTIVKTIK